MAEQSRPPLRALVQRSDVNKTENALLQAMLEHCSDGQHVYASRERLAAWAKLSTKTVHRLIYGWFDKRNGKRHPGLCKRGILTELVKPRRFENSAKYRINEFALSTDPRVEPYLERDRERARQMKLPGIIRPPKPGIPQQPVSDAPPLAHGTPCPPPWDTVSVDHGTPCPVDPKAPIDPKAVDPGAPAAFFLGWKGTKTHVANNHGRQATLLANRDAARKRIMDRGPAGDPS